MGEPRERGKEVSTREEDCPKAAEVLCEWPSLPHLGVTIVSCQKWPRRGDSGEVVPLVADGG